MHFSSFLSVLTLSLSTISNAQQFAGTSVNNSLPNVFGAEIAYFNIKDDNRKNATLINYSSTGSQGQRLNPKDVKRAVIFIHGQLRDPWLYAQNILTAFSTRDPSRTDISLDNVQMVMPYFANGDDKNFGYPYNSSLATKKSTSDCLVWQGSGWMRGDSTQYPTAKKVSSFAVLDQMVKYFDNKTIFPNMQQIVVGGHSAGGQTTQRYVMIGDQLKTATPVNYYVANPNSYAWMSEDRPLDTSSCPDYDDWKEGLSDFNQTYGATLVSSGRAAVLANYNSKTVNYGRGLLDVYDDSSTCAAPTTGINRNERFYNFIKDFPVSYPSTIDYVNVAHDAYGMISSVAGMSRLFYDNFNGDGSKHYDIGCPRQQLGDDPFPDPSCNGQVKPIADAGTYNGWQYEGCYTDVYSKRSLSKWLWEASSNTSIQTCTQACGSAGYSIAGLEYGNECFCGTSLSTNSFGPLVEVSCGTPCAGNGTQICGDSNRLSIFSFNSTLIVPTNSSMSNSTLNNMTTSTNVASSTGVYMNSTTSLTATASAGVSNTDLTTLTTIKTSTTIPSTALTNITTPVSSTSATSTTFTSSPPPTSVSTPLPTLSCPSSDGTLFTTLSTTFQIQCYNDSMYSDIGSGNAAPSLEACLAICANTTACVDVSFLPSEKVCWIKSTLNAGTRNTNVWGAKKIGKAGGGGGGATTGSASMSSATTTTSSATTFLTSTKATTSPTASSTTAAPTPTLPNPWRPLGCYTDSPTRLFEVNLFTNASMTPYLCASACRDAGYYIAGGEYANECWCSHTQPAAKYLTSDDMCSWGCWADNSQKCGGPYLLSVWGNVPVLGR